MRFPKHLGTALVAPSGLVTAVALALIIQGVAGASASSVTHVKVTGKDYASQVRVKSRPLPDVAGLIRLDDEVWGGRQVASDPRVTGRYAASFDTWEWEDGIAHFADLRMSLTNATGSWQGTSLGVRTADGSHLIRALADGRGAYRGLRYVAVFHDRASGTSGSHLLEIDGWIETAATALPKIVVTDDVHTRISGTSTPVSVLPVRGDLRAGFERTSDPRTTGRYRGTMKLWRYQDGRMHFKGTYELSGREGLWRGEWHGVVTRDRRYVEFVDARGTGDLAGLRYRHVNSGRYPASSPKTITLTVTGWVESVR